MAKLAHIVNPVSAAPGSELAVVQPITFESMRRAKGHCSQEVELIAVTSGDPAVEGFMASAHLSRSIKDVRGISEERPLPFLHDILDAGIQATDAEYIIFTNVDIVVNRMFYDLVAGYIKDGHDAFIINRRRVSRRFDSPDQLDEIFAETGKEHGGFDCFVFKRDLFSSFILGEVCIGIPHVGNTLAHNLICFANDFRLFTNKHLTFHVGMELVKNWGPSDVNAHNKREFRKVLKQLKPVFKIANFPGSNLGFFKRHYKWLMHPNFHYPTMMSLDLGQLGSKRKPRVPDEGIQTNGRYYERLMRKINF